MTHPASENIPTTSRSVSGGICLVIDPGMESKRLLATLQEVLDEGIELLQIWNHWPERADERKKREVTGLICDLAHPHGVPVLINDEWQLLDSVDLDGVHFDALPDDTLLQKIRTGVGRPVLFGLTCGNDPETVVHASSGKFDYLSFCSMFPSSSAGECEIVHPDSVRRARSTTRLPLFV